MEAEPFVTQEILRSGNVLAAELLSMLEATVGLFFVIMKLLILRLT